MNEMLYHCRNNWPGVISKELLPLKDCRYGCSARLGTAPYKTVGSVPRTDRTMDTHPFDLQTAPIAGIFIRNKTCQGYARKRILKPAGYFFLGDVQ
jgi:hypothetical protein